jgi:hypothetical protein
MVMHTVLIKDFPQEKLLVKSFSPIMGAHHINLKKESNHTPSFCQKKKWFDLEPAKEQSCEGVNFW